MNMTHDQIQKSLLEESFELDSIDENGVELYTRNDTNVFLSPDGGVIITLEFLS